MELIRKPIHYTQEGKSIFDQFYLDEDYNVPDQKEDVQRIIQGNAELKPEDIRPVENYVKITGKVYFKVLYMTASGDPRPAVLEGKIPFEEMVYAEGDGNETFFLRNVRTEFTATVVNTRKLSLRIMSEMEVGREWIRDEELTEDVESDVPIYRKTQNMNLLRLAVTRKDTYRIKEELTLPGTKESIGQRISASENWISEWVRTRSFSGEICLYSVCICRRRRNPTGLSRACLLREGSSVTASPKTCITIYSILLRIRWRISGWMRMERCASLGLRRPFRCG